MNQAPQDEFAIDPEMQRAGHLILENRLSEAERVVEQVSGQRPDDPEPHYVLGVIYQNTQRLAAAEAKFRRAIELDPEFAEAYCRLGAIRSGEGRTTEAASAFLRATEIDPEMAEAHSRLADALTAQGRRRDATAAYRRAAEVAADTPLGHLAFARALEAESKLLEAEEVLRRLVGADQNEHTATAYALLGSVLAQLGRFAEAIACLDQAIALAPDDASGYFGRVNAGRLTAGDRPLVERMTALLEKPGPDATRMILHFALGKAYDDLGGYAAAMRHFDAANLIRGRSGRLDQVGLAEWVERLVGHCTQAFFARHGHVGSDSERPLFILGMPRSGTTLVEQILSSHPAVAAGGEMGFWHRHGAGWDPAGPDGFDWLTRVRLAQEYLAELAEISSDALRVTDKNPWNFQWVGMIRQAFPNARFVHCRRDPVDTCLSVYFNHFTTAQRFMSDRADLAFYYRQYARLMEHWRRVLPPDRYTEVNYSLLVGDSEAEIRRLIAFCDLEWDDACLHHEANRGTVRTASVWQARQPIYRGSLERWRHYQPWLGELRQLLPVE